MTKDYPRTISTAFATNIRYGEMEISSIFTASSFCNWGQSWMIMKLFASVCSWNIRADFASGTFGKMLNLINEGGGHMQGHVCYTWHRYTSIEATISLEGDWFVQSFVKIENGKMGSTATWRNMCFAVADCWCHSEKLILDVIKFFEVDQIFGGHAHVR